MVKKRWVTIKFNNQVFTNETSPTKIAKKSPVAVGSKLVQNKQFVMLSESDSDSTSSSDDDNEDFTNNDDQKMPFTNKAAEECVLEDTDEDKSVSDNSTYDSDSDSPYGIPHSFKILENIILKPVLEPLLIDLFQKCQKMVISQASAQKTQ